MAQIRFYHLMRTSEDMAIASIAAKAFQTGKRVLVRVKDGAQAELINNALWTFKADSFVPHGTAKDGDAELQPVFIGVDGQNVNGAEILILSSAVAHEAMDVFDLRCEMLDGEDEEKILAARARWKEYRAQGLDVSYWQETEQGWVKKG